MNILVVAFFRSEGTPVAPFVYDQVKAYSQMGHNVRVIVPFPIGKQRFDGKKQVHMLEKMCIDGVDFLFFRYLSFSNLGETLGLNTLFAKTALCSIYHKVSDGFQADIIHAHTLGTASILASCLKKKFDCPLVVTTHGSDTTIPFINGESEKIKTYADKSDVVVCVSSTLMDKLEKCGVKTPFRSILNGFNISALIEQKSRDKFKIVQVGNLIPQKNHSITLKAVAELRKVYPQISLTIVGRGEEMDNLKKLSCDLGIHDIVEFTGYLPNREVLKIMSESRFFVMPSVREGFGIVYLEAMASGCITIGTEGEGIADLIVSGENGFLVPPDDPQAIVDVIEKCISDSERADEIAERGKKDALELTWEKNAKEYVELFKSLI